MKTGTDRKSGGQPLWGISRDYWVNIGGEPFLRRKILVICPWFGIFLTRIYAPDDAKRDPHDHSRWFASLILSGGYAENVYDDPARLMPVTRRHRRGSVHMMPVSRAHAITAVAGPLRTLVLAGPSRGTWAFWTPAGKVDWKDYG